MRLKSAIHIEGMYKNIATRRNVLAIFLADFETAVTAFDQIANVNIATTNFFKLTLKIRLNSDILLHWDNLLFLLYYSLKL